jgi:hypothetical protein
MRKLNVWLLILILCFLALIYFRMYVTPIAASSIGDTDKDLFGSYLTMQANQFALLQVYLSAFGIILTGLGIVLAAAAIWGYKELKKIALKIAVNKIQEIVPALVKIEIGKLVPEEQARASFEVAMEKFPVSNSNEVLTDCVLAMNKDPMDMPSGIYIEDK